MITLSRKRNPEANSRNVRLNIKTYEQLERMLIELIAKKGVRLTLNDAVKVLLDEHDQHQEE